MGYPHDIGSQAEERACDHLLRLGWTVVARRVKSRFGEVDVVALDGDELVFLEVKFRSDANASPEQAVSADKLRRIRIAAQDYLQRSGLSGKPWRFDVVAITPTELRHHQRVGDDRAES